MTKIRITPFLISNPLIILWAIYALIVLLNRDGMAAIMSGFFVGLIFVSSVLLLADRFVVGKVNIWLLTTIELLILLTCFKFVDSYY
jgi:hypothetical protein